MLIFATVLNLPLRDEITYSILEVMCNGSCQRIPASVVTNDFYAVEVCMVSTKARFSGSLVLPCVHISRFHLRYPFCSDLMSLFKYTV